MLEYDHLLDNSRQSKAMSSISFQVKSQMSWWHGHLPKPGLDRPPVVKKNRLQLLMHPFSRKILAPTGFMLFQRHRSDRLVRCIKPFQSLGTGAESTCNNTYKIVHNCDDTHD
ncbi:Valine--tRNA ligase [Dissostichus eleginoides]|uniref:Valine--tRNA ligase n=1 Tax=Dissostichus eleginoides TaxID=100907 RepID=A0AAD9F2X6_DISEL|nr:Valine--tRNA ligase [Dissostichus eleginoides]